MSKTCILLLIFKIQNYIFLAYLDGLHFQKVHGVNYSEIWIFISAACIIILVIISGIIVVHKKKRRKNSISSDMEFCEDQTPHRDVISYLLIKFNV